MTKLTSFMWPCVTYVLTRTSIDQDPALFMKQEGWKRETFALDEAEPGDIVCWENDSTRMDVTLEIRDGIPVSKNIKVKDHYGVYEGNNLVSDLTIDGEWYAPRIRVQDVTEGRMPTFIIKKQEEKQ